ncbi:MAG: TonB family protein [Candidatus Eisenbacteria bacterium]
MKRETHTPSRLILTRSAAPSRAAGFALVLPTAPLLMAQLALALIVAAVLLTAVPPAFSADAEAETEFIPTAVSVPARLERLIPVQYPDAARREGISGVVVVRARVGRDGRVRETQVEHSIPALDEYAQSLVRRYEFLPARDEIGEVETWVDVPVRFDEALPRGARGGEHVGSARYPDVERSFESDVTVLQQTDPVLPNPDDAALRARIMSGSLLLEAIPPPGAEAIRAFLEGDSLARSTLQEVRDRRRQGWIRAAHLAPWWTLPYLRLAGISVAERDFATAEICISVLQAGRPGYAAALALQRRARQLQLAEGRNQRGRSKK